MVRDTGREMRLVILTTLLLLPMWSLSAATGQRDVIARVNKHVITRQEVLERAFETLKQFEPTADPVTRAEMQQRTMSIALGSLINETLLLDEGEKLIEKYQGLKLQIEERVDEEIERRTQAAGSKAALHSQLGREETSLNDLKKEIRDGLLIDAALLILVRLKVNIAPAKVRELYEKEHTLVSYRQIVVTASSDDDEETARDAASLVARARAGEDFARLARENSDGPHRDRGGLWELSRRAVPDLKGGIGAVLLELAPGEVSDPVAVDGTYRILKLESISAKPDAPPFEEVQEEFLNELTMKARQRRLDELLNRLRREGHIKIFSPQVEESNASEE